MDSNFQDELLNLLSGILISVLFLLGFGFFFGFFSSKIAILNKFFMNKRLRLLLGLILILIPITVYSLDRNLTGYALSFIAINAFLLELGIFLIFYGPIIKLGRFITSDGQIRTLDLRGMQNFKVINPNSTEDKSAFIGTSPIKNKAIYLSEYQRSQHVLVSGATGTGKTTVLISLFHDAIRNEYPVLVIDPKGDDENIRHMRKIAEEAGVPRDKFKVFSLLKPNSSSKYNPLARGDSTSLHNRIVECLVWSEPFYKNQAAAWLASIIEILTELEIKITIPLLHRILDSRKELEEIEDKIKEFPDKDKGKKLMDKLKKATKKQGENLDNLLSQLRSINQETIGHLLEPDAKTSEIDLDSAIKNREIIYFNLSTMSYTETAYAIGKLVLADIKALAGEIQGRTEREDRVFFPIFVDEFGSFATTDFIELLKQVRSINFGLHLFFQGLADLVAVSPEFKTQVQTNCGTKIILRTDDPEEAEFWTRVCGTMDSFESSFQVKNGFFTSNLKTGMGNSRAVKKQKVEHDVFKELTVGSAICLEKVPSPRLNLIKLWHPNL